MNKKKAISILKNQIKKLESKENLNHRWTIETRTYLSTFFGKDSEQYKHLDKFYWKPSVADDPEKFKPHIVSFINDCINTINSIGLKKDPVNNWFSRLPDWLMSLILTALFGLGIIIGTITNDKQNFELRQENKDLKQELLLISSDTISNPKNPLKN